MLKLPFFSRKKLLLAFEYGVILSQVALENNIKVTPEMMKRAEELIIPEFTDSTPTRLSTQMVPNLLAILQPDDTIKA